MKLTPEKWENKMQKFRRSSTLKDSAFVIADCVTHLTNLSINSGEVPSEWKQAKVVPLLKSGNER